MPEQKIKFIAIVNGLAAVLHIVFWTVVFFRLPPVSMILKDLDPCEITTTRGLGIADLVWSVPLLSLGSWWLQKHRLLGWLCAQVANVLWGYSFTFVFFQEYSMHMCISMVFFLPFALFSIWSAYSLWNLRFVFIEKEHGMLKG